MAALQLVRNKSTREVCTPEDNAAIFCRETCYDNRLVVRAVGQSMVMSPPLTISHAEVDDMVAILARALDATAQKLGQRLG